jgi:hypothetical protein
MPRLFLAVFIPAVSTFLLVMGIGRTMIARRRRWAAKHSADWRTRRSE